jgi:hypothetical protein
MDRRLCGPQSRAGLGAGEERISSVPRSRTSFVHNSVDIMTDVIDLSGDSSLD